ncbi:unnamed protein product [Ilex paraguariensis]|uniref:Chlororespiratory reduction 3 n=1 Tax=Ilex paraguariensis TaxID=185542 RepID=A0ABC8UEF2_9AQUA
MASINFISMPKTRILASSLPNNTSPSLPPHTKPNSRRQTTSPPPPLTVEPKQRQKQQQNQPSIAEIERAIGAGTFRDRDTSGGDSEQNQTMFDVIFSNSIGKTEGSVEKKLRETGEWIIDRTETSSRSDGKRILLIVFLGVLPMWILSFLVASGIIKLPFSSPFLDDLIM